MNLHFEAYIYNGVLARGGEYYESGNITSLRYTDDEWVAYVEGGDNYTVTVKLSDSGDIEEAFCNCRYDWGEYCKHQVAVFFALREQGAQLTDELKKSNKAESLDDILSQLDKQTLISLLLEYAKTYKTMASEIRFRYSKHADKAEAARKRVQSAIHAASCGGYVEYDDVRNAVSGADEVLNMTDGMLDAGELMQAISLAFIVAEEMMDLMNNCDDSNGYASGAVSKAIEKIHSAILAAPPEKSNEMFTAVLHHALNDMYDGREDWRVQLFSALVPLCGDKNNRTQLEHHLITRDIPEISTWGQKYSRRQKQRIQLEIISQFDGKAAAQSYINENLDNIDFRYMAIKTAIENKQYEKAEALCIEGEKENHSSPGVVKNLRQLLYSVYEATQNLPKQKALAMELLTGGDFGYFLKYKNLHDKNEWAAMLESFLNTLENADRHRIYVKVLEHEKHKLRLLAYCQQYDAIIKHHKILLPEYEIEAARLFAEHIRHLASRANNRADYSDVCDIIQICAQSFPNAADEVYAEILQTYTRRPAFMDEMRKIAAIVKQPS